MNLKELLRDPTYDHRKLKNAPDVIQTLRQMGMPNKEIAKECGVSESLVSQWASRTEPKLPNYSQMHPLLVKKGIGRFNCDIEPINPAAREYSPVRERLAIALAWGLLLTVFWLGFVTPCTSEWNQCQRLHFYQMPFYLMISNAEKLEALKSSAR